MSEAILIALITQTGALLTAVIVALIQNRKYRNERSTAREDRDIAVQTVRTLEMEAEVQSAHCSPSLPSLPPASATTPATGSAVTDGEPT